VEAAATLLGTFREAAYHEPLLRTVSDRLEIRMLRHVHYSAALGYDEADRFATAILVGFPKAASGGPTRRDSASCPPEGTGVPEGPVPPAPPGTVQVINFGHEPPLVISPEGVRSLPLGDGLPLGLSELAYDPPSLLDVVLDLGETLLLVTDGVTEARDSAGVFFPLRDSVTRAVADDPSTADPQNLVEFVRDATLRHCGGRLADDTTIFAVRRQQPPVSEVSAASQPAQGVS